MKKALSIIIMLLTLILSAVSASASESTRKESGSGTWNVYDESVKDYESLNTNSGQLFNQHRQNLGKGTLVVDSDPQGADVYLDGVKIGTTPLKKEIGSGKYATITVEKNEYKEFATTEFIASGRDTKIYAKLEEYSSEYGSYEIPLESLVFYITGDVQEKTYPYVYEMLRNKNGDLYLVFGYSKEIKLSEAKFMAGQNERIFAPEEKVRMQGFGVAFSPDNGKTWKFIAKNSDFPKPEKRKVSKTEYLSEFELNRCTERKANEITRLQNLYNGCSQQYGSGSPWCTSHKAALEQEKQRDCNKQATLHFYFLEDEYLRSEIQGISPADDGGFYVYYYMYRFRVKNYDGTFSSMKFPNYVNYHKDHSDIPEPSKTIESKSELRAVYINKKSFPTDFIVSDKLIVPEIYTLSCTGFKTLRCYLAGLSMKFVGESKGRQYFIEDEQLYVSKDGGTTLKQRGFEGIKAENPRPEQHQSYDTMDVYLENSDEEIFAIKRIKTAGDNTLYDPNALYKLELYKLSGSAFNKIETEGMKKEGKPWSLFPNSFFFDSRNNLHAIYAASENTEGQYKVNIYYELISDSDIGSKPLEYESVDIVVGNNCPTCSVMKEFLNKNGIKISSESVEDVAKPIALIKTRDGTVKREGFDEIEFSQLFGITRKPELIPSSFGSLYARTYPELRFDRNGNPYLLIPEDGGVYKYSRNSNSWSKNKIGGETRAYAISKDYSGGNVIEFSTRTYEDTTVKDYFHSGEEKPVGQVIKKKVSQLIPGEEFYVLIDEKTGQPQKLTGALASYVVEEGVITESGEKWYKVKVDLRKQGEKAYWGEVDSRKITGFLKFENHNIVLQLDVLNDELRIFESKRPTRTHYLSFIASRSDDGSWLLANNLALPNVLLCKQSLEIPANSYVHVSYEQAKQYGLDKCLNGFETDPVSELACEELKEDNIKAYAKSIGFKEDENGLSNYEKFFGNSAKIYRLVKVLDGSSLNVCGIDLTNKDVCLLEFSGPIISDSVEEYNPAATTVKCIDGVKSRDKVEMPAEKITSKSQLDWEKAKLEFEADFLEAGIKRSTFEEDLAETFPWVKTPYKESYRKQLLATRAVLHCANKGRSIKSVMDYVYKKSNSYSQYKYDMACLNDFRLNPSRYWYGFIVTEWDEYLGDLNFVENIIKESVKTNPTLGYLDDVSRGIPVNYEVKLLRLGKIAETQFSDVSYTISADYYGRLRQLLLIDSDEETLIKHRVLLMSKLERQEIKAIQECANQMNDENPFSEMYRITNSKEFKAGLPCADKQSMPDEKMRYYQLVGLGIRGDLMRTILLKSNGDIDTIRQRIDLWINVINDVEAVENKYRNYDIHSDYSIWKTYSPSISTFDRLTMIHIHMRNLDLKKPNKLKASQVYQSMEGAYQCGESVVASFTDPETKVSSIALLTGGIAAITAGGPYALGAGIFFMGTGAYSTYDSSITLAEQWEALDLEGKTASLCDIASNLMDVAEGGVGLTKPLKKTPKGHDVQSKIIRDKIPEEGRYRGDVGNSLEKSKAKGGSKKELGKKVDSRDPVLEEKIRFMEDSPIKDRMREFGEASEYQYRSEFSKNIFDQLIDAIRQEVEKASMSDNVDEKKIGRALKTKKDELLKDIGEKYGRDSPEYQAAESDIDSFIIKVLDLETKFGVKVGCSWPCKTFGDLGSTLKTAFKSGEYKDFTDLAKKASADAETKDVFSKYKAGANPVRVFKNRLLERLMGTKKFLEMIKDAHVKNEKGLVSKLQSGELHDISKTFGMEEIGTNVHEIFFRTLGETDLHVQIASYLKQNGIDPQNVKSMTVKLIDGGQYGVAYRFEFSDGSKTVKFELIKATDKQIKIATELGRSEIGAQTLDYPGQTTFDINQVQEDNFGFPVKDPGTGGRVPVHKEYLMFRQHIEGLSIKQGMSSHLISNEKIGGVAAKVDVALLAYFDIASDGSMTHVSRPRELSHDTLAASLGITADDIIMDTNNNNQPVIRTLDINKLKTIYVQGNGLSNPYTPYELLHQRIHHELVKDFLDSNAPKSELHNFLKGYYEGMVSELRRIYGHDEGTRLSREFLQELKLSLKRDQRNEYPLLFDADTAIRNIDEIMANSYLGVN